MAVNLTTTYKQLALKWLTGKYQRTPDINNIMFNEFENVENKLKHLMEGLYFPYGFNIKGIVQGNNTNGQGLEYSVAYGNYQNQDQTHTAGFILIFDEKYNVVQIIKQYSNEEYFGDIISMNVGKDGRFFMVEYDNNSYYRFVLLNNILAKSPTQEEYQVVMRQTYRFPDQSILDSSHYFLKIVKHPQEARYLMAQINHATNNFNAIEFVINVGSENEWNYYSIQSGGIGSSYPYVQDILASWDENNNLTFKSLAVDYRPSANSVCCYQYTKASNSDTLVNNILTIKENVTSYDNVAYMQAIIKNFDIDYFSLSTKILGDYTNYLYIIDENNTYAFETMEHVIPYDFEGIQMTKYDDDIFCSYVNITNYAGIIINNELYSTSNYDFQSSSGLTFINVQKIFNLYILYVQTGNYVNIAKLIYIDKYNNTMSINFTSMNPYYGILYNEDDQIIFARTLYNKSISGQTTTATIQVPNQYINDEQINSQGMFGRTYYRLITSTDAFTKNQYEEVYVNFANTWNIINENDINNPILNPTAASRFNLAISQATPDPYYPEDPTQAGIYEYAYSWTHYYRINYSDNTYRDINFYDEDIEQTQTTPYLKYTYYIRFIAPSDKEIINIQIISNDKQTIYQTIDNLEIEAGKYYELTQDVYVV